MARRRFAVLLFAIAVAIVLPTMTFAAVNPVGTGLVPCGVSSDPAVATECEACNVVQLVQNVIMFMIGIAIPIAMAMFAWAGILYFTSATNSENIGKAKRIFSSSMFGFVLALAAWLIVNTILYTILDSKQYPNSSWFKIDCSVIERPRTGNLAEALAKNFLGFSPPVAVQSPVSFVADCGGGDFVYDSSKNLCVNKKTGAMKDPIKITPTFTGSGVLCDSDNLACSPDALMRAGVSAARANAMSCIAVTESSGNPTERSKTSTACGTWQILKSNWENPQVNSGACGNMSCSNAECNMRVAIALGNNRKASGQSYYADWTCPGCNNKAAACVAKYDPGN